MIFETLMHSLLVKPKEKGNYLFCVAWQIELIIPATSSYLIESKSFKLYLNSSNNERIKDTAIPLEIIKRDLSKSVNASEAWIADLQKYSNEFQSLTDIVETILQIARERTSLHKVLAQQDFYQAILNASSPCQLIRSLGVKMKAV